MLKHKAKQKPKYIGLKKEHLNHASVNTTWKQRGSGLLHFMFLWQESLKKQTENHFFLRKTDALQSTSGQ